MNFRCPNRPIPLIVTVVTIGVLCGVASPPAQAARYADDLFGSGTLEKRVTSGTFVPLYDGRRLLGELELRVSPGGARQVHPKKLLALIGNILPDRTAAALQTAPGNLLSLDSLGRLGVKLRYDEASAALFTDLSADERSPETITMAGRRAPVAATPPADVSAVANLSVETTHFWEREETAVRFSGESVLNIHQFVFEHEFDVDTEVQLNGCAPNIPCASEPEGGFKRRGTRMVRDFPDERLRLTVGDIRSTAALMGRSRDIAGAYLEHSDRKLAPDERVTGAGSSSFRLERPSRVEVSINGAMMQAIDLPAGNYTLNDLPLQTGANRITLTIIDNQGISRAIELEQYSAEDLLAQGRSEWTVAAGVPSYFDAGALAYQDDDFFASAYGRHGLLTDLTLEGEAQTDGTTTLATVGGLTVTPWGIWGLDGSLSVSGGDVAAAARATWRLRLDTTESFYASAEIHASDFRLPGQSYEPITGTFVSPYAQKATLAASYARQLPWDNFLTVSGRYDLADAKYTEAVPYTPQGDRYALDLSISRRIFETGSLTATVGYSNQTFGSRWLDEDLASRSNSPDPELWAGLRLSWRPREGATISASTESLNNRSYLQGGYSTSDGPTAWMTSVTAHDDNLGTTSFAPSLGYRGQRAEVQVSHDTGFESFLSGSAQGLQPENRTYARLGTSLVYADGHVGVSAPLRGNGGFAILYPHETVEDQDVVVGNAANPKAYTDGLGPVVVRDLMPHSDSMIVYDMPDLPMDLSLGSGSYGVHPSYRSGYALQVGSANNVTLIGRLLAGDGEPLGYASGTASDGERTVPVFTTKSGKFAVDSLAPGRWVLSVADDSGDLAYEVEVPHDARGNLRVGDLRP
ncbi:fimbria/pilus outer membrane usher protein [Hyphomicrobium sp. 1Nfss2.1]|uniref:fimbria/pilus outer membrane usher protein n=1 Tax=Hyphomicrobium sp. 1Nfss2.1 TaxID=3413936 RepID=UPI003C7CEFA2